MPKGQHVWYTPEEKMGIIQKYLSCNNTVEGFCKDNGVSKSTLYKWLKIYTEANSVESLPTKVLCFDEIYSKKLTTTKYSFCMYDPIT